MATATMTTAATKTSHDADLTVHERDSSLIKKARGIISRQGSVAPEMGIREELERLVDEYDIACQLAHGPVPNRSAHWMGKSRKLWAALKTMVENI